MRRNAPVHRKAQRLKIDKATEVPSVWIPYMNDFGDEKKRVYL